MEKNNFLPYNIRKKREILKNNVFNSIIAILFFINIVLLINLYLKLAHYKNMAPIKEEGGIQLQNKGENSVVNFKDADTLKLICDKIKDKNYTHIIIKNKNVQLEFPCREDFERSIKDIENDSNFFVNNLTKSKDSDKYNMFIEVKSR